MEIENQLIAIIILSLIIGIIIGILITREKERNSSKLRKLEENLNLEKKYRSAYEEKVISHFSQTAQLINKLTESYRDVHAHLSEGAEQLCKGESIDAILKLERKEDASVDQNLNPPLDYAPKASPMQRGVLNESFGLEGNVGTDTIPDHKEQ